VRRKKEKKDLCHFMKRTKNSPTGFSLVVKEKKPTSPAMHQTNS
jgi:hypothetical protein